MGKENKVILDMDGTLYKFDQGSGNTFSGSQFYADIKDNVYDFLMDKLGLSRDEALREFARIKTQYNGEISLGVEQEFGINRNEYFGATWNLNPEKYITRDDELPEAIEQVRGRVALLTAAPRVWAVNVLAYLNIEKMFGDNIFTGEPDLRKPNPLIFDYVATSMNAKPSDVYSIGDQEESDIIPAKSIGMRTVFVGPGTSQIADYSAENVKMALQLLKQEGVL